MYEGYGSRSVCHQIIIYCQKLLALDYIVMKTLHPYTNMGKLQHAITWIQRRESKIPAIKCDRPWQNQPYCAKDRFELRQPLPTTTFELLLQT